MKRLITLEPDQSAARIAIDPGDSQGSTRSQPIAAEAGPGLMLALAERDGQRCGGPVLLAGLVVGFGVVELAAGPLGQTSRFSLELLILLVLQLMGPMLVTVLAMALATIRDDEPDPWLERVERLGLKAWRQSVPAAALTGSLLLLLFLTAAVTGGVLASPRGDLIGEIRDLLSGVLLVDLLRAWLRAGVFLAAICGWSQWRVARGLRRGTPVSEQVSNLLVQGLMVLLALKLLWVTALDPLHLSASAQ